MSPTNEILTTFAQGYLLLSSEDQWPARGTFSPVQQKWQLFTKFDNSQQPTNNTTTTHHRSESERAATAPVAAFSVLVRSMVSALGRAVATEKLGGGLKNGAPHSVNGSAALSATTTWWLHTYTGYAL